jgi:hypothetical protein
MSVERPHAGKLPAPADARTGRTGVHDTEYGLVHVLPHSVTIEGTSEQLRAWADRSGAEWPSSDLEGCSSVFAQFDESGLLDLTTSPTLDVPSDELTAWASDVLGTVLPRSHAAWFVTVGQFQP